MITETEFVLIRTFDKQMAQATTASQRIIDRKNRELEAAGRIIAKLSADLKASEAKYAHLQRQITHSALS
tara:strand:+ start:37209 stop:37418 length:210 start_codon:yes stop_codon:yes gene_type:complete